MSFSRFAPVLPFALALTACASTPETDQNLAAPPQGGQAAAEKDGEKKGEKEADDLRKKERELEYARQQLAIARLSAQLDESSAKNALAAAERELTAARAELQNFATVARELEIAERVLAVDRSKQNLVEAQEELAELEAMYSQEDFAETTKELVLVRGRNNLAMAKRGLELAERRFEQLRAFDHPKRERELTEKVTKSEQTLAEARTKLEKLGLDQKLSALKAEHGIDELEREIAKLREKTAGEAAASS